VITGPDDRFGVSVSTVLIGGVVLKPVLGLRAVLRVADIDPSCVKADGVDGAARLDKQVNGVADLVLVAVRGLDTVKCEPPYGTT
jgi:hypothetical protein